jgi:MFS family permease
MLWLVLCLNVTAGIGILEQASPMIQEMFKGRVTAAAAAGFVGLLSLFNMLGRFGWSSCSDFIGRKPTYMIFFVLGAILYVAVTFTGQTGLNSVALFVLCSVVIISMYGGGFATIPAYIRDLFGTMHVSAIHGRILTAWSAAGILGPVLVNYIRQYQVQHGVAPANAYSVVLYIMAGLLVLGFICNLMVRPVSETVVAESTQRMQAALPGTRGVQHAWPQAAPQPAAPGAHPIETHEAHVTDRPSVEPAPHDRATDERTRT